ncbi:hypothetical protein BKA00_002398 [Actinomadura coerulea]|uniref:Uncharacterized protein n=1 Tax=Actinomadura coerulea TaxID=46159 RepID=A0A7X0FXC6_9ACTN|nr:hypothetical protein [Actinomadura coerulea]MBB6395484.1 hypothetical protein [Actinomadura coerulea]GGQ25952.1 hypothetical protein GCM10010187_48220 [Actinomadura coerulea]
MADPTPQERAFARDMFRGAADLSAQNAERAETPEAAEEAEIAAGAYRSVAEDIDNGTL